MIWFFPSKKLNRIISPSLTGIILGSNPTIENWRLVFYIAAAINGVGAIVWTLFSSGKRQ